MWSHWSPMIYTSSSNSSSSSCFRQPDYLPAYRRWWSLERFKITSPRNVFVSSCDGLGCRVASKIKTNWSNRFCDHTKIIWSIFWYFPNGGSRPILHVGLIRFAPTQHVDCTLFSLEMGNSRPLFRLASALFKQKFSNWYFLTTNQCEKWPASILNTEVSSHNNYTKVLLNVTSLKDNM